MHISVCTSFMNLKPKTSVLPISVLRNGLFSSKLPFQGETPSLGATPSPTQITFFGGSVMISSQMKCGIACSDVQRATSASHSIVAAVSVAQTVLPTIPTNWGLCLPKLKMFSFIWTRYFLN